MSQSPIWVRPTAIAGLVFGGLTVFSGGMVLFGSAAVKSAAGDAVPLVLWFNFLAGFLYIIGALALYYRAAWAGPMAWVIGLGSLGVFIVLIALALSGTAFEWRTIGAMVVRSGFWLAIAAALRNQEIEKGI